MPKCKKCGKELKKQDAFAVKTGKYNSYYCSEEEYQEVQKEGQLYKDINKKVFEIFGYYIKNTAYYSNLNELHKLYTWQQIFDCILENEQLLDRLMQKDFDNEYGKIRYFVVVVKNKLSEHKPQVKETFIKHVEEDVPDIKYKRKVRKKVIADFELEMW